jgi:ElaB/YqjD/DUF883 family membrane-anchored ribosome-binding protein
MDFSAKLENLKAKVDEIVTTAQAAAAEDRDKLKQRVDQAQDDANQPVEDAKQRGREAADRAQSKWAQMKADAAPGEKTSRQRSMRGPISWAPRLRPRMPTGPSRMHSMRSTTRLGGRRRSASRARRARRPRVRRRVGQHRRLLRPRRGVRLPTD